MVPRVSKFRNRWKRLMPTSVPPVILHCPAEQERRRRPFTRVPNPPPVTSALAESPRETTESKQLVKKTLKITL